MNSELLIILNSITKLERYKQYRMCLDVLNKDIGCAGALICDNCVLRRDTLSSNRYPRNIIEKFI